MSDDSSGHPRRPPRLERVFSSLRSFYFVTFNTYRRTPCLAVPEIHESFRSYVALAQEHDIAVGRYVIMPDHVHLFIVLPPTGITLTRWIAMLRNVLGKELLRLGLQKPHWQEGFFDHLLRRRESYSEKWEYVRMNPLRAGLCRTSEEWPYQGEIIAVRS